MNKIKLLPLILFFLVLLGSMAGCSKADDFYQELQDLPQIDNSTANAYSPSYLVGEEMTIIGRLNIKDNFSISIGGVQAQILHQDTVRGANSKQLMDKVTIAITEEMEGLNREVLVTSGGNTVHGNSIDVFGELGEHSIDQSLRGSLLKDFGYDRSTIYLFCLNGKGDVFYYGPDKKMYRLTKDKTEVEILDLSAGIEGASVSQFLAGGVDASLKNLYFSVKTASDYRLYRLDLATKGLTLLNKNTSTTITKPYEGTISQVGLIVTGIYPADNGDVFMINGLGSSPLGGDALIVYKNNEIKYIFKGLSSSSTSGSSYKDMPGISFPDGYKAVSLRFSPEERLVYKIGMMATNSNGTVTIHVYDLDTRSLLKSFSTVAPSTTGSNTVYTAFGRFSNLTLDLGVDGFSISMKPDNSYGYLPMPGMGLVSLLYQNYKESASYGYPKWIYFDFNSGLSYAYAPGRYNRNSYNFTGTTESFIDKLLNYDGDGNLYSSASGRTKIIKTQKVN